MAEIQKPSVSSTEKTLEDIAIIAARTASLSLLIQEAFGGRQTEKEDFDGRNSDGAV